MFLSLDFLYVPTADVDAAARWYLEVAGAHLRWLVRAMGTEVACVQVSADGPAVLLSGHLRGPTPVLVYRVDDYAAAVAALRENGMHELTELEIPHGPVAVFEGPDGQRIAVYELVRPGADEHFDGRVDPPDPRDDVGSPLECSAGAATSDSAALSRPDGE